MISAEPVHLSVVIPAFNEQARLPETLRQVIRYLSAQSYRAEILIVDDGSTDHTAAIVSHWPASGIPIGLLTHPGRLNRGKGAAVQLGMSACRGRFRLFMDADNSTSLDHVEGFWPAFDRGCDVVIGSRSLPGSKVVVHQPKYKEIAGRMGNRLIQALAVPGICDTQAGFKMFSERSAEAIFPRLTVQRWGFDIEVLAVARALDYKIQELPIVWINASGSKVGLGSYFEVLREVWRVRRNIRSGLYARTLPRK
jgi:dolichyl-phosphate beta-glucosyltransferase